MDIVYYIWDNSKNNFSELKYSLRSLKNIEHDNVYIIWFKPKWVKDVIHIPAKDWSDRLMNALNKLKLACETKEISNDFIMMHDDFYFIKPVKQIQIANKGTIKELLKEKEDKGQVGKYTEAIKRTLELFPDWLDFSLHTPCVINKEKFLEMCDTYDMSNSYLVRTVYFNFLKKKWIKMNDVKIYIWEEQTIWKNQKYLSTDDNTLFQEPVRSLFVKIFHEESSYEDEGCGCKKHNKKGTETVRIRFLRTLSNYKRNSIVDYPKANYDGNKFLQTYTELIDNDL